MTERIQSLYKTHILELAKKADQPSKPEKYTYELEAYNPLCGDKFVLYLNIVGDSILDIGFQGYGCAISKASTVLLTKVLRGKSISQVEYLIKLFMELTDERSAKSPEELFSEDEFLAFAAARDFPERRTCATLAWTELKDQLDELA